MFESPSTRSSEKNTKYTKPSESIEVTADDEVTIATAKEDADTSLQVVMSGFLYKRGGLLKNKW